MIPEITKWGYIMKMKKIAALLLCGMLTVSSLTGCGSQSNDSAAASQDTAEGSAEDLSALAIEERKAGEHPTVVIAFPTWTGRPVGMDRIQQLISDYAEEQIGCRVEFEVLDYGSYVQNVTLMFSSGEQVDIYNATRLGYANMISKENCYDLEADGLIQTYGAGILDTIEPEYVDACRANGILYGIPQMRDMAAGMGGYCIGKSFLDEIQYDYVSIDDDPDDEFVYTDLETVEEIFEQLHEAYPDKAVFLPNKSTHLRNNILVDDIGGDYFGVLMDPENSLEVTNLFESDEFRELCERMYRWNQNGWISRDALTETATPQEQMNAGLGLAHLSSTKPGIKASQEAQTGEIVIFKVAGDFLRAGAVTSMNWCLNSQTEDPVAAMQVLNMLYTDPYVANLLAWGEEGVDYVKNADGFIEFPEGIDSTTSEYSHGMNWLLPNQYITEVFTGNSLDVYEKTREFNNESIKSKALGFTFDNSGVAAEYTALTNVYNEYIYQLILGFVDPETGIQEMNERLYDAGLEKYMAAKTEALNTWAAGNGIQ